MQRHPALQDLSRDHFVALNHVVKARRVRERDQFAEPLATVWAGLLHLWDELEVHFDEEEEDLLPLLDDREGDELAMRLRTEHGQLRQAFAEMGGRPEPDVTRLWNTAEALRIHIRWEEEIVFETLQKSLREDELQGLLRRGRSFRITRRGPDSVAAGRSS